MNKTLLACSVASACLVTTSALASETVTYTYDALGRLVASSTSGGPNSGVASGVSYDPAGNRSSYTITGSLSSLNLKKRPPTMMAKRRRLSRPSDSKS